MGPRCLYPGIHPEQAQNLQTYTQKGGVGWCTDKNGLEGTARRYVGGAGLDLGLADLQDQCTKDPACVAVSHYSASDDVAGSGRSVLYTSDRCEAGCSRTEWLTNPSLIVTSSARPLEGNRDDPGQADDPFTCYVKTFAGSTSNDAKCYVRLPTGCKAGLSELPGYTPAGSGTGWFLDSVVGQASQAVCRSRIGAFNRHCGAVDAEVSWGDEPLEYYGPAWAWSLGRDVSSTYALGNSGTSECPAGYRMFDQLGCEGASNFLARNAKAYPKRGFAEGWWDHLPSGCTVLDKAPAPFTGGSLVDDWTGHWNWNPTPNQSATEFGFFTPVCKNASLGARVWYDSYSPATFAGASAFCAERGGRMATLAEYCGTGVVFEGRKHDGDQWAPYSGGGDDQYVQVGNSWHPECTQRTPTYGKPVWGTSTHALAAKKYVLCTVPGGARSDAGDGLYTFVKKDGEACGNGNDIECGVYASQNAIEAACSANSNCAAYSVTNGTLDGQLGVGSPWCTKSKYTSGGGVESGRDCHVKEVTSGTVDSRNAGTRCLAQGFHQ